MSNQQHTPDDTECDLDHVFQVFEDAWYEDPPRYLTVDMLCELFVDSPAWHPAIRADFPARRKGLREQEIRIALRDALDNNRLVDLEQLVGHDRDLLNWAKAEYDRLRKRVVPPNIRPMPPEAKPQPTPGERDERSQNLITHALATLNLKDYPGDRSEYLKRLATDPHNLRPIERDFEIRAVAGTGGFGVVFEVKDHVLNRWVAIKKALPEQVGNSGFLERLEREAVILAMLEHPNILPMYGLLKRKGPQDPLSEPAFVMRLLPKTLVRKKSSSFDHSPGTPRVVVRRLKDDILDFHESTLPWDSSQPRRQQFRRLLQQFVEVCHGIAYAHQRCVVHRDIKPANVVIGPHGETVVIDWGIAKVLVDDPVNDSDLSRPATQVADLGWEFNLDGSGTEEYASPEQMGKHRQLTESGVRQPTDVFALGATLFTLLTGKVPCKDIPYQTRFEMFPDWVPPALREVVTRATAFDPWRRYLSPRELQWYAERPLGVDHQAAAASLRTLETTSDPSAEPLPGGVEQLRRAVEGWLEADAHQRIAEPLMREIEAQTDQLRRNRKEAETIQREMNDIQQQKLAVLKEKTTTEQALHEKQSELVATQRREEVLRRRALAFKKMTLALIAAAVLVAVASFYINSRQASDNQQLNSEKEHVSRDKQTLQGQVQKIESEKEKLVAAIEQQDMQILEGKRRSSELTKTNEALLKEARQNKEAAKAKESISEFLRSSTIANEALSRIDERRFAEAVSLLNKDTAPPDTFAWNFVRQATGMELLQTFSGAPDGIAAHRGAVLAVAASPDGQHYLTFGNDGRLLTWDAAQQIPIKESQIGPTVGRLGLGYDVVDEQVVVTQVVAGMPAAATGLIQPQDQILSLGDVETSLISVAGKSLNDIGKMLAGEPETILFGQFLRVGGKPQVIGIRRQAVSTITKWQLIQRFSPDTRWLAASATLPDSTVAVWLIDTATGTTRKEWKLAKAPLGQDLMSLNFSADSNRLVLAGIFPHDGASREAQPVSKGIVIDLTSPEFQQIDEQAAISNFSVGWVFTAGGQDILGLGLSSTTPFSRWRVGAKPDDVTIQPQRITNLGSMGDLTSATPFMSCASLDGRFVAIVGLNQVVQIFSGDGSQYLLALDKKGPRRGVAFSPDSGLIANANGQTITIHQTNGWQQIAQVPFEMTYQSSGIHPSLAFTPDGQTLLIGSENGLQASPLQKLIENPAVTSFGSLAKFSAARWTSQGTLWVAEDGGSSPGVAVREIRPDGSVVKTLASSVLGQQHALPVMSRNGQHVRIPRTRSPWATDSHLESWKLDPQPYRVWSYSGQGNAARPYRDLPDGEMLIEFSANRFGMAGDALLPKTYHVVGDQGHRMRMLPRQTGEPWRVTPQGQLIVLNPGPLATLKQGPRPSASIRVGLWDAMNSSVLGVQALNAVTSDDGKFLAALVVDAKQLEGSYGTLTVYRLPEFEVMATLKDRQIATPMDFGLNFSPDGKRVVVGTLQGELIVWDYGRGTLIVDTTWSAAGWVAPWISGATFTPDGDRVVLSAFDQNDLLNLERLGRDPSLLHGGIAVVDLTAKTPTIRQVRSDVGMAMLGEASIDRRRVCSVNAANGDVYVWNIAEGDPQQVAYIDDGASGKYDPKWAEFAVIRTIAPSADGTRVAIAGPVGSDDAKKSRIVVFDVATRDVVHTVDAEIGIVDDLTWLANELRLLTHDPIVTGQQKRVQLLRWDLTAAPPVKVKEYGEIGPIQMAAMGALLRPEFSSDASRFAIPMLSGKPSIQNVVIFATDDGHEVARPVNAPANEALHAFQWTNDGSIVLSTIDYVNHSRHVAIWDPATQEYRRFTVEKSQATGDAFYNTGIFQVAMSPDGESIAVQRHNQAFLEIWSATEQKFFGKIELAETAVLDMLRFSPSGDALFMGGFAVGGQILRAPRLPVPAVQAAP